METIHGIVSVNSFKESLHKEKPFSQFFRLSPRLSLLEELFIAHPLRDWSSKDGRLCRHKIKFEHYLDVD